MIIGMLKQRKHFPDEFAAGKAMRVEFGLVPVFGSSKATHSLAMSP